MAEQVVLINENDSFLGLMEKQKAHIEGLLHRAFSIFVFNDKKELMLQQRAAHKYHSPLLWTNTCCSHPRANETYIDAAHRRLKEEMGFDCDLNYAFDFIYKADVGGGLTEHELDYVFIGTYNDNPILNLDEAENYKWISLEDLKKDMQQNSTEYTEWFKIIFAKFNDKIKI